MSSPTPSMPPLPPSRDEASFSELIPIRSSKISILKSPFLVFGVVTGIVCVMLFLGRGQILMSRTAQEMFNNSVTTTNILVGYILFVMMWIIHSYSRTDRSLFYYIWPILGVWVLLMPFAFNLFVLVFREILPGEMGSEPTAGFVPAFIGMFFGAGLCEEILKATPALLCVYVFANPNVSKSLPPKVAEFLRIRGPLDGLLMCTAAGAMFIFIETAHQYVPMAFTHSFRQDPNNPLGAWASALMLLIPRTIQAFSGHMGWNGIAGYFIGLAVIRPKAGLKLIVIGILAASVLHGLWNSVSRLHPLLLYVVGIVTVVIFLACLLKARQIQISQFGAAADTGGSILVGATATPGAPAPQMAPPTAPRMAPPPPPSAPSAPRAAAAPPAPVAPAAAPTVPVAGLSLTLVFGGRRMALNAAQRLDLGNGILAEVTQHPQNPSVLGLRNLSAAGWTVTLPDARQHLLEPQKNIRLSPGLRIDFGGGAIGLVAAV